MRAICQTHAEKLVGKEQGQNVNERNQQNDFPQQRQEQGNFCLAQRQKRLLETGLCAEREHAEQENAYCPNGGVHQFRIAGKNPHEYLGDQHDAKPEQGAVGQRAGEQ